jgi:hypothetical protein
MTGWSVFNPGVNKHSCHRTSCPRGTSDALLGVAAEPPPPHPLFRLRLYTVACCKARTLRLPYGCDGVLKHFLPRGQLCSKLNRIAPSSGLLRGVKFETDVSGPPTGPIFKGQAFFLDTLTLEDGTIQEILKRRFQTTSRLVITLKTEELSSTAAKSLRSGVLKIIHSMTMTNSFRRFGRNRPSSGWDTTSKYTTKLLKLQVLFKTRYHFYK